MGIYVKVSGKCQGREAPGERGEKRESGGRGGREGGQGVAGSLVVRLLKGISSGDNRIAGLLVPPHTTTKHILVVCLLAEFGESVALKLGHKRFPHVKLHNRNLAT